MTKRGYRRPSKRVREYARGIWDMDKRDTKQMIALNAGYSNSQARIPQRIEQTVGFRLAMAEIATVASNATMAAMYEIVARQQAGEMADYPLDKLIGFTEKLATITDRLSRPLQRMPKDIEESPVKKAMRIYLAEQQTTP